MSASSLASTPPGMPGTHPPIFWLGGRQREYPPPNIITYFRIQQNNTGCPPFGLKPISFGYKTPQIRFSQAGGQSAHKARPPYNLELALTPLRQLLGASCSNTKCLLSNSRFQRPGHSSRVINVVYFNWHTASLGSFVTADLRCKCIIVSAFKSQEIKDILKRNISFATFIIIIIMQR